MPGKTLGHYALEAEAGTGGLGAVYRAYDSRLRRPVAIKVLHEDLRQGTGWEQILAEARAASALNHPNICTIYEVGEAQDQAYIAMEFVDGKPLGQMIPAGGLPVDTALRYGIQIAEALAHGHEKGVCHGDLTSCNIMVDQDDRIKILDFGLAQRFAVADSTALGAERVARGRPAALADIQRFGAVLHEMATGMMAGPRESLDANLSHISPALRVPIHRSLHAGSTGGYEEVSEARDDLRSCLSPASFSPPESPALPGSERPHHSFSRRSKMLTAIGAAILLGAIGFGALRFYKVTRAAVAQERHQLAPSKLARKKHGLAITDSPGDPNVKVWANIKTRVYHCPGTRWFGKTKEGQFMTQAEAEKQGYKAEAGRTCEANR